MAEFVCRLGMPSGEIVTRTVEANAAGEVKKMLETEGYRVFEVSSSESNGAFASLPFGGGKSALKSDDFLLFNQQLSALLRAGIPVLQSVGMLRKRSASGRMREVLTEVEEKIRGGVPLSEAFESQKLFPRIYTASILAGERSGALDDVLARYVSFLKRSVGIKRKVRGALAYPMFLLAASLIMVMFLSIYVVPQMASLFGNLSKGRGLPTITVVVVTISNAVASNILWVAPLFLVIVGAIYYWSRTPKGKLFFDRIILRTPLLGNLVVRMTTAQVTRSMATLLAGGITVPESWEIASESITNAELRLRSEAVLSTVREGRGLTESLENTDWMPELALDMIGIGEKSGSLREMLDEVAGFYDAESEVRLEQLTALLEPVILVVMASFVIVILLAIYLPIIQTISTPMGGGR
ncbi:MAG: type II secretion system F family protein [Pyrinomonadaceae bacterium]|nr:type II secretion system F family protein [Pyrinomonadaceae bacterium]